MNVKEDISSSGSSNDEDITDHEQPCLEWQSEHLKECQNAANIPHIFDMPTVPHSKMQVSFIIYFTHDVHLYILFIYT